MDGILYLGKSLSGATVLRGCCADCDVLPEMANFRVGDLGDAVMQPCCHFYIPTITTGSQCL